MDFKELKPILDDTKFLNLYIDMQKGNVAVVGRPNLSVLGCSFYILKTVNVGKLVLWPYEENRSKYNFVAVYGIAEVYGENLPFRMMLKTYSAGNVKDVKMQFAKVCNEKGLFPDRDKSLCNIQFKFQAQKRTYGNKANTYFEFIPAFAFAENQDGEKTACIPINQNTGKVSKRLEMFELAETQPYAKVGGEVVDGKTLLDRNKEVLDIINEKLFDVDLLSEMAKYKENFEGMKDEHFQMLSTKQGLTALAFEKGLISAEYYQTCINNLSNASQGLTKLLTA